MSARSPPPPRRFRLPPAMPGQWHACGRRGATPWPSVPGARPPAKDCLQNTSSATAGVKGQGRAKTPQAPRPRLAR
eukprot:7284107-Alexandrium_andersonii.AAC.1